MTPPELSRLERNGTPQIVILLDGSTWRHEGDCVWAQEVSEGGVESNDAEGSLKAR